jgi:polyhydroxybutyrate depolymerase
MAYPLVFNLHGYTSNAAQAELYTKMDVSADAHHYIVVYPNGIGNYWNSWGAPGVTGADDVKFIRELIDTMAVRYNIDQQRVYSCGMSNGGYMSYTLACGLSDRIAAIASVSGTMSTYTYAGCSPGRRVPVMHIHGTADQVVPYATGAANSIGVEQLLAFWRDTDMCGTLADTIDLPNTNLADSCTVRKIDYAHCNTSELLFYKINNGGHTWPGAPFNTPPYGYTDKDISATDEIWKFFEKYTLSGPAGIDKLPIEKTRSLYPDPATDKLYITAIKDADAIRIYDMTGREVLSAIGAGQLDISPLSPGLYAVSISARNGYSTTLKFVKR